MCRCSDASSSPLADSSSGTRPAFKAQCGIPACVAEGVGFRTHCPPNGGQRFRAHSVQTAKALPEPSRQAGGTSGGTKTGRCPCKHPCDSSWPALARVDLSRTPTSRSDCRNHARLSHKSRALEKIPMTGGEARQSGDGLALLRGGSQLGAVAVGNPHNEIALRRIYATASRESGSADVRGEKPDGQRQATE